MHYVTVSSIRKGLYFMESKRRSPVKVILIIGIMLSMALYFIPEFKEKVYVGIDFIKGLWRKK